MAIMTVEATTWAHLQELLFGDPWPASAGDFHSSLAHRGMASAGWRMETSLQRHKVVDMERHLYRNFRKYARQPGAAPVSSWDWLTIAQHHSLPTRVLDWTFSPLVALHFATWNRDYATSDAVVWTIDIPELHKHLPPTLVKALDRDGSKVFTTRALDDAIPEPLSSTGSGADYFLMFEPPSLDDRVVNQYAALSYGSDPAIVFEDWLRDQPVELARRVIVPARLKHECREKLDQANISERMLFPGLDGLSQWLTRYYTTGRRDWVGSGEDRAS